MVHPPPPVGGGVSRTADGGGVTLRSPRETELRDARTVRETPPPTFAGHLLPQGEEDPSDAAVECRLALALPRLQVLDGLLDPPRAGLGRLGLVQRHRVAA